MLTKNGSSKLDEIFVNLKSITNDKASDVRKASYSMIARLLYGFSPLTLKKYESSLVQLLLNGLTDENPEVQELVAGLLESAGESIKKIEENHDIKEEKAEN